MAQESAMSRPITVVYVGGAGRSGSTLLERLICERPGYFAVGELRYLWERGLGRDERCSCGERFSSCPLWHGVLEEAFGGRGPEDVEALKSSLDELLRIRRVPQYRVPALQGEHFRDRLARVSEVYARLFRAIAHRTGASVIVDSSKSGPYGYFLAANPLLDVRVLHLVRDSRAVAYSWQRQKRRPEANEQSRYMPTFTPARSSQIWWEHNLLVGGLRRRVERSALLRYEDFTDRVELVTEALEQLGLAPPPTIAGDDARSHRHSVSGNPSRLEREPARVTQDAAWLAEMDPDDIRLVTRLTAPGLLRYGYPLFPSGAGTAGS
jgi:hypothetical protein